MLLLSASGQTARVFSRTRFCPEIEPSGTVRRLHRGLIFALAMLLASATAHAATPLTLLTHWQKETVAPSRMFATGIAGLPFYPTPSAACTGRMPAPWGTNPRITHENPAPAYQNGSLGCSYKVTYTYTDGHPTQVIDPNFYQNWVQPYEPCPAGFSHVSGPGGSSGSCQKSKPVEENSCAVGNPMYPGRGFKTQTEYDYRSPAGRSPLFFARQYASWHYQPSGKSIGGWFIELFGRYLSIDGNFIVATRALGETAAFDLTNGSWVARSTTSDGLMPFNDGNGSAWRYLDAKNHAHEFYDADGLLLRVELFSGTVYTLTYSDVDTPASIAPEPGFLIEIAAETGAALHLAYNADGRLVTMEDPAGQQYLYSYIGGEGNSSALLDKVTYPDASERRYYYEPERGPLAFVDLAAPPRPYTQSEMNAFSGSYVTGTVDDVSYAPASAFANHLVLNGEQATRPLTGIGDENGNRFASWTYDALGRPVLSEHAGGAESTSIIYGTTTAQITGPFGASSTYTYVNQAHRRELTSISGAPMTFICGNFKSQITNYNGTINSRTNWNNVTTTYQYNAARLETSRIEAAWTSNARTISTQWDLNLLKPTQINEPGRRTTLTYDSRGNVLTKTVLDTATSQSRTWTFTYNSQGQVLSMDGPRTDVSDVTTFTYHSCTTGFECGQLHTITDALGRVTTFSSYNAHGQPLSVQDPNGLVTTLTYDLRQRLTSQTVGSETTSFEYWPTGLLKRATLPDGSYLAYTYDAAHRLVQIQDQEGNRVSYTLDAMGNRTRVDVYDPSSTLTNTRSQVFNALNQLAQDVAAANTAAVTTTLGYDTQGNETTVSAPLGRNAAQAYDPLNRLKQVTDPAGGVTQYGYNPLDQLISVTDPRNKVTSYTYNAFGDVTRVVSPDTGTTNSTFDSAGNLQTQTDARGAAVTYTYDALNRVTQAVRSDQTIQYTYDQGPNALGRLSSVSDNSGQTSWTYDIHGRPVSRQQIMGGISLGASVSYDSAGRPSIASYPSGHYLQFGYANGKVTSITLDGSTPILADVLYEPFGPVRGWTWGNSTLAVHGRDLDGKVEYIDSAGLRTYSYDDAFRITGITDAVDPALSQSHSYDLLDRLTGTDGSSLSQNWTYDPNGNRLTEGGSNASTYSIAATSNRLTSVTGALTRSYSYDAAGNTLSDGTTNFTYDQAGRLVSASKSGITATYALNALGQRVRKTVAGVSTYFFYDESGRLMGEYDSAGAMVQEIVWLGDTPVASIRPVAGGSSVGVFYIHTDHLGAPTKLTRPNDNAIVWRWDRDPFGNGTPDEDPDGNSQIVQFNLRFPGQYFDAETGLNYNYFRDYDPATGRYVQSDPIGLEGGINTYAYVNSNPLSYTDPLGLNPGIGCLAGSWAGPIGCGIGAGIGTAIVGGAALAAMMSIPGDTPRTEQCTDKKPCPPCKTVSGKVVPVGTIGYRPMETPTKPQHGIVGPHFNIYRANQNPNNCQCFWQSVGAVPPTGVPAGAIPIEPFAN